MNTDVKLHQGTPAWFEMVGTLLCEAAIKIGLSPNLNLSLVERYTDGTELPDGLAQGLCFDIRGGKPSFRIGVRPDERADVTIHVTVAAARMLNTVRSDDPDYSTLVDAYLDTGEMRVDGDLTPLGTWFAEVHDPIVDHTVNSRTTHWQTEDQGGRT